MSRLASVFCVLAWLEAAAQRFEASAGALTVQNHSRFSSSHLEQSGNWIGGDASGQFGRIALAVSGAMGSLAGSSDSLLPDRTARSTTVAALIMAKPWLAIGGNVEAKVFKTDVGDRAWLLMGGTIRLTPSLDGGGLEGLLDVTAWPVAKVVNGEKISLALRTTVGATYRLRSNRVGVRLAYRFERFDFEGDGTNARLEQFRGAMAGLVLRFGR